MKITFSAERMLESASGADVQAKRSNTARTTVAFGSLRTEHAPVC